MRYGYYPTQQTRNPFQGLTDLQREYYRSEPAAVHGAYLGQYGPGQISGQYRRFLESWLPDMYRQWQGAVANDPELDYAAYVGQQNPYAAYEATNPYARGLRAAFRTRWVRR